MKNPITVYGLRNRDGQIVYVGRTRNVDKRRTKHSYVHPGCEFVGLETCSEEMAWERELYYIREFDAKGQAQFNRRGRLSKRRIKISTTLEESDLKRIERIAETDLSNVGLIMRKAILKGLPLIEKDVLGESFAGKNIPRKRNQKLAA